MGRVAVTSSSRRTLTHSATQQKALPFALNSFTRTGKSTTEDGFLRMLMFGKPGAGKGTLAARLVRKYDMLTFSTGDLLRQHIAERTEVGRQAEEIVAHGGLLPDEIMLKVITSKLDAAKGKHWILDGFPRTLGQGELLDSHLKKQGTPLSLVINLDVQDEIILSRISDRWVHLPSGRVYSMSYNQPKVEGRDDVTGEPLIKRPDDNPEIFGRRLAQFYKSTSPLLSYYEGASTRSSPAANLVTIKGTSSDEIWPKLDGAVRTSFPRLRERATMLEGRRRHSLSEAVLADRAGVPVRASVKDLLASKGRKGDE